MTTITQNPQKINVNLHHTRCPGCFCWKKTSHFVWVPPGLIDETELVVCISCAITIRHAFSVRNEKTVRDVAAIVANTINYSELEGASE